MHRTICEASTRFHSAIMTSGFCRASRSVARAKLVCPKVLGRAAITNGAVKPVPELCFLTRYELFFFFKKRP